MARLVALDVALLPPPDVSQRAIAVSATLPVEEPHGLRLDSEHLPHITLTQQFVREEELERALEPVDAVLREQPPFEVVVTGAGKSGHTVWLAIERSPILVGLHERLMEALRGFERPEGTPAAFVDGEGRVADVVWVSGYRLKSSFGQFLPHLTLGHGETAPEIQPFTFQASTVAACHLGRFCTCRHVLRRWELRS